MSIQPRELSSAAEIIANRRAVRTYFKTLPAWQPAAPPPKPAPEPQPEPQSEPIINETPEPELPPSPDESIPTRSVSKAVAARRISHMIARYYNITEVSLFGDSRRTKFVLPRHIAFYLCMEHLGLSSPDTGRLTGGYDHSTVLTAIKRLPRKIEKNPALATDIAGFVRQIEEWK